MRLIKELYAVLPAVMLLNILSILFTFKKNSNTTHNEQEKSIFLWKDWLSLTIIGISALLLIGCVIFFSDNIFIAIMYNLMFFLFYARGITNAFLSSDCLWNIITGRSNGNFSRNESSAIFWIAMLVSWIFNPSILEKACLFTSQLSNFVYSDLLTITLYVLSISVLSFFICALVIEPLKLILRILVKGGSNFFAKRIQKVGENLEKSISGPIGIRLYSIEVVEHSLEALALIKLLWLLSLIPVLFADIAKMICYFIRLFILGALWYLFLIIRFVIMIARRICVWLISLSDKRIVAVSFRIAVILGLGCTVLINRYAPFLHYNEESTAVLEFIASALIIPVVLNWISSYSRLDLKEK